MKIAFIGLGNMGVPMATNILAAGHDVTGFDTAATPTDIAMAASAAEAVTGAETVITMLPNGGALRAVADEILPAMTRGAVFLDCSTVDVASARAVAAQAETHGLHALDAPVSGGTVGAKAGTLTFMVGGSTEALTRAAPLLEIMGGRHVHCGPSGNGQAAKICNNMILGATMAVTCEAFALADGLGLDRQALYDVASTSSGQSWSLTTYCPAPGIGPKSPADDDYRPGFAAEMMLKDLDLARQAAEATGTDTPLGAEALRRYEAFLAGGGKGKDFSALLPHLTSKPHT